MTVCPKHFLINTFWLKLFPMTEEGLDVVFIAKVNVTIHCGLGCTEKLRFCFVTQARSQKHKRGQKHLTKSVKFRKSNLFLKNTFSYKSYGKRFEGKVPAPL